MDTVPMTVLETPFFLRKAAGLLTEDERDQLVAFLGATPDAGDIIPETGGGAETSLGSEGEREAERRASDLLLPQ